VTDSYPASARALAVGPNDTRVITTVKSVGVKC
jgi:hypothetical protein